MSLLVTDRALASGAVVRTLTLDRPDRRNALSPEQLGRLRAAVEAVERDSSVRALVIAGSGRAFCSGYDLGTAFPEGDSAPDTIVVETMRAVRACAVPVIARVQGAAFGAGLELAISCDLRVCSTHVSFCLPPARLGIAYAPEGLARLVSLVGTARARRMTFTAQVVDAATALDWGLVDELVAADALDAAVESLANTVASMAPLAVRAMKRTFNALEAALGAAERNSAERERISCYGSADASEGLEAFMQKRPPIFRGV